MDDYIKDVSNNIDFNSNKLNLINNFYLTNKEIEVLEYYGINYKNAISLKEIIYYLDQINDDNDDLVDALESIQTRDYYMNTNK